MLMRRAVVLGGSMAGLLAARVLSDHCSEVLIIERDPGSDGGAARPGVPQGTQLHSLLPAGQAQLERWFPGFFAESAAEGSIEPGPDALRFYMNGALREKPPVGGGQALINTRPFLEQQVRRRVVAIDRVRVVPGRADGLTFDGDRVTGVTIRDDTGEPAGLEADLVVDATGRSSRLSDWLEAAGWPRPPMQRMGIRLNYASALFARAEPDRDAPVTIAHTTAARGRRPRIGGILPVEGGRWIVLIAGYADDRPDRDVEEFTRRCRDDFPEMFGRIATSGRRLTDVVTYHQADSRRRDFDRLDRLPAGIIAAGDAVASFNPVYGQGMTSAALHASALSEHLRSAPDLNAPATAYFDRVRVVVDAAWEMSTFADLALPHVEGPYPKGYRLKSWIGDMIYEAAGTDQVVNDRLGLVTTMLAHPSALATPSVVLRALGTRLRGLARRPQPAAA